MNLSYRRSKFYIAGIGNYAFSSCDLDLDPMTFTYELDLYLLKMYIVAPRKNLTASRLLKVIVLHVVSVVSYFAYTTLIFIKHMYIQRSYTDRCHGNYYGLSPLSVASSILRMLSSVFTGSEHPSASSSNWRSCLPLSLIHI